MVIDDFMPTQAHKDEAQHQLAELTRQITNDSTEITTARSPRSRLLVTSTLEDQH
jgi:hypothetical protein